MRRRRHTEFICSLRRLSCVIRADPCQLLGEVISVSWRFLTGKANGRMVCSLLRSYLAGPYKNSRFNTAFGTEHYGVRLLLAFRELWLHSAETLN